MQFGNQAGATPVFVRFEAQPAFNLMRLLVHNVGVEVEDKKSVPIHSVLIPLGEGEIKKHGIIVPHNGLISVAVLSKEEPFAELIEYKFNAVEPPSVDGLEGIISITVLVARFVIDIWVKAGKPTKWNLTRKEVDDFLEEKRQALLKKIEEEKKGGDEPPKSTGRLLLP